MVRHLHQLTGCSSFASFANVWTTGFILNKVPAGKWLGINVCLWGISTAVVAATRNYAGLLTARIFLGIFEAAVGPCLMIISSQWYTKHEQPSRFGFW